LNCEGPTDEKSSSSEVGGGDVGIFACFVSEFNTGGGSMMKGNLVDELNKGCDDRSVT